MGHREKQHIKRAKELPKQPLEKWVYGETPDTYKNAIIIVQT